MLLVLAVREALRVRLIGARDLIIDSAPILARRRRDPDAASGHAPAHHPTAFLRGFRAHTLLCRGSGLPLFVVVSRPTATMPPSPSSCSPGRYGSTTCARAGSAWTPRTGGWPSSTGSTPPSARSRVVPWNPKRSKNRDCLPPTWTLPELGKRSGIERFFGRVFPFFRLQRPPVVGWTAVVQRVALTYAATIVVALAAHHAGRPGPHPLTQTGPPPTSG